MTPVFEQAQRFTELWADLVSKIASAAFAGSASSTPPEVARQIRSAVFQSMSQSTEDFLRSPMFLAMMKQSLDATLACRKRMDEFLTAMHHNTQGIARQDIDSMMLLIRHLETRILDRIEGISTRMDTICKRLEEIEGGEHAANQGKSQE